jgi:hypothetical protein
MSTELVKTESKADVMEKVLLEGDLAKLQPSERLWYYNAVCESLGLNPLTKPFAYIPLNGKLCFYATRACTEQLRKIHNISIEITSREKVNDVYIVTAKATNKDGRFDESVGAVSLGNLKGDALSNAIMKCETKAKRRVTLSLAGLGWIDESEIETIPNTKKVEVNDEGEIIGEPLKKSEKITLAQRKELFEIACDNVELVSLMIKKFGYLRTDEVCVEDFNDICSQIASHILEAELDGQKEYDYNG